MLCDRNWREFGIHKNYVIMSGRKEKIAMSESSSEKRPLMRGWCHFFQTIALITLLITEYDELNIESAVFIAGKLCCVAASANLHMIGFSSERDYQIANAIDWSMIVMSGGGNVACLALSKRFNSTDLLRNTLIVAPIFLSVVVGSLIFKGERSRSNNLQLSRRYFIQAKVLILMGFALAIFVEIQILGVISNLYTIRIAMILAGFASWQAKRPGQKTFFWHSVSVWGGHEDFHFLIFIADLLLCVVYFRADVFETRLGFGKWIGLNLNWIL